MMPPASSSSADATAPADATDAIATARDLARRLAAAEDGVHFFPIRHHSPACARHLAAGFAELKPRTVLIEMPEDFAALMPLLQDAATRPPIAIVSVPDAKADKSAARGPSYWPLSATAPEFVAVRLASELGATLVFCDLPSGARALRASLPEEPQEDVPGRVKPAGEEQQPLVLTDEHAFDHSAYIKALVARWGCRDWNELWDRLFESRLAETDWRRFFADLAVYCALARAAHAADALERDGTLAREGRMRAHLDTAIAKAARPIAVVTGGFHTPPLLLRDATAATRPGSGKPLPMRAFLVRYSHDWLDRLNGYAAGMPHPAYYERLHVAAAAEGEPFRAVAEDVMLNLAARLRTDKPALAPRVPALTAALRQAIDLADLRGLPGPGRVEILDAARSCFVKDEDPRYGAPILEELVRDLTGSAIGDVPASAGSPPIVEAARAQARSFGFTVTDAGQRKRELDIHRNARRRDASRFLHAMALLGTNFGRLEQGPDYAVGIDLDVLFEVWDYAWSPLVEARLVERAADGDSVERACATELLRAAAALEQEGKARSADAVARLVFSAAQIGLAQTFDQLLPKLSAMIIEDADLIRVAACLRTLFLLWRARRSLGFTGSPTLARVLAVCYRRAVDLVRLLAEASPEHAPALVAALADVREVLDGAEPGTFDRELFDGAILSLVETSLAPALAGAVATLAVVAGRLPPDRLADTIAGALGGAAVEPADRVAPLAAMLTIAPELIRRIDVIVARIDAVLGALDEERFIELLPHLRLAFTRLDPADAHALSGIIAGRHGLDAHAIDLTAELPVSPAELAKNVELAQALTRVLAADGLNAWLVQAP